MISQNSIQEVLNVASVEDVVQDFVNLRRRGVNMIGLCPFHNEKTPSFTVSPTKNIYKCFGCGKGGNSVQFMMDHEQLTFPESIRFLAKKYNIELEETAVSEEYKEEQQLTDSLYLINDFARDYFTNLLLNTDEGKSIGLSYFKKRGFLESTIKEFELGYSIGAKNAFFEAAVKKKYNKSHIYKLGLSKENGYDFFRERVVFPIHNLSGKVVGFGARTLSSNKKIPKYLNSPESEIYNKRKSLYGLYFAKRDIRIEDQCILVEGYTDTISLHQAGIKNVVASSGTSLTIDQIKLIKRYTNNIKVLYDGDTAGIKAAMRGMNLILEQDMNIKMVLLPDGADPDSHLSDLGVTDFKNYIDKEAVDFILFQTKLISEEAGNDPIQKAILLKEIVSSIAKIPDTIKRALYIQQCSKLLDMSEDILIRETNKNINVDIKRKRIEYDRQALKTENQEQFISEKKSIKQVQYQVLENDVHLEKNLAHLVVNHGQKQFSLEPEGVEMISIVEFVYNNLEPYFDEFDNKDYHRLIEIAHKEYITNKDINQRFFTDHSDPFIQEFSVNALSSPYQFAKWQERGAGLMTQKDPEENYFKDARKSIIRYVLRKLIRKIDNYKIDIKNLESQKADAHEMLSILKKVKILQDERNQLSKEIDTNLIYRI